MVEFVFLVYNKNMSVRQKSGLLVKLFWLIVCILLMSVNDITLGYLLQFEWHHDLWQTFMNFFNTDVPQKVIPATASST